MNWYEKISRHIMDNLDLFLAHFFSNSVQVTRGSKIFLEPAPCCGHRECFAAAKDKPTSLCYSCGESRSHIKLVEEVWGVEAGRRELEKWSGIYYNGPTNTKEATPEEKMEKRLQQIYHIVMDFYHYQLLQIEDFQHALDKQTGTNIIKGERSHTEDTLRRFNVGISATDYQVVKELLKRKEFTEEEIELASKFIWVPPHYYVYPYYDAKGNIVRITAKVYKRTCQGNFKNGRYDYNCGFSTLDTSKKAMKEHEEKTGHKMSPKSFSRGDKEKSIFKDPTKKKKYKYCILVEGEDDVLSVEEALLQLPNEYIRDFTVWGLGGNVPDGFFEIPLFRQFDEIFEAFDADEAGDKYRERLNAEAPDIRVNHIQLDDGFSDIDQFLKAPLELGEPPLLYLLNNAEFVESSDVLFERVRSHQHEWVARNRSYELRFKIERYKKTTSQFDGTLEIYQDKQPVGKKTGGLDKVNIPGTYEAARIKLSNHLDAYYNEVKWDKGVPVRPFDELIDCIRHTNNHHQVCRQIAYYLYTASNNSNEEYKRLYSIFRKRISDEKIDAEVLKEVNAFSNSDIDPNDLPVQINLSQHFSVPNDDAFFYFSRVVKDGDDPKLVPCLLTNKKEEIRLDLFKRRDPQSLLLIKNKYELTQEVPTAVMEKFEVSLQPYWVDRWVNNEVDEDELNPLKIIQDIESFISRCYYLDTSTRKVLALWIYATYFYMMFKSGFPYLLFTGEKGTGKSTLDLIVYLLALNAKIAINMSEAVLFRSINFEGGTFILDEIENLTDKKKVDSDGYATVLKGGYSKGGAVYRLKVDNGNYSKETFNVFGPKVISNINGLEDVIADRCIYIRTYRIDEKHLQNLEEVQDFLEDRRSEAHNITSRCVLSALTYFKDVDALNTKKGMLQTGTARLSQIVRPLQVMAKFVGGDYEEHLMNFYNQEIVKTKEEISDATLEGKIRRIFKTAAMELTGLEKSKWVTNRVGTLYDKEINYNKAMGKFEIDNVHIKMLCEEIDTESPVSLTQVHKTVRNIMGPGFKKGEHFIYTSTTFPNENLQKLFGGKTGSKCYRYTLGIQDFLTNEEFKKIIKNGETSEPLF